MHFDWRSSLLTLLLIPVLRYISKRASGFARKIAKQALDAAFWLAERALIGSISNRVSLKRYCNVQLAKAGTKYLQVPGNRDVVLQTDVAFVPLSMENAERRRFPSNEAMWDDGRNRLQIVGDPGSGKSSLVKNLFRRACRRALRDARQPLPLLVELSRLSVPKRLPSNDAYSNWMIKYLRAMVEEVHGFNMVQLFDASLTGRGISVYLDGLDEVSTADYPRVVRAVRALHKALENSNPANQIAITMRSQFYRQIRGDLAEDFPSVFHIQPFSPGDTFDFLTKWPFVDHAEGRKEANRIFAELTDRPTLREMCSNPLVLAMYVANDQAGERVGAPDTRTAFYVKVVEELLVARRSRQLGTAAKSALREQREKVIGRLALANLEDPARTANSISWDEAIRTTEEVCRSKNRNAAEGKFREICKETGIVIEERHEESVRFIHLTFCEFMAAKEVASHGNVGWNRLAHTYAQLNSVSAQTASRLIEVLPFVLGLLPREERGEAIASVWSHKDQTLLGRCFLESQCYDHPAWSEFVRAESKFILSTPQEDWGVTWMRRLHLFSVILADEGEWAKLYDQGPTLSLELLLSELVRSKKSRMVSIFSSYAVLDPQAAFRVAKACGIDLTWDQPALVVANMSSPPFRAMILEAMQGGAAGNSNWASICSEAALAGGGVSETLGQLPWDYVWSSAKAREILPRESRWFLADGSTSSAAFRSSTALGLSLLTLALTLATADSRSAKLNASVFPRTTILSRVRAPGDRFFSHLLWLTPKNSALLTAVLAIACVWSTLDDLTGANVANLLGMALAILLVLFLFWELATLPRKCAVVYERILKSGGATYLTKQPDDKYWPLPQPSQVIASSMCRGVRGAAKEILRLGRV